MKVVSFSNEVGANFGTERVTKSDYAFTTSTSRIVTGAYNIKNKNSLSDFFTQDFSNDLGTMSSDQLIRKYGTHVMLGAVLGARADYHLSVQKKEQDNITNLGAYAKAKAEATYMGVTGGVGYSVEGDAKFKQYFNTETTDTKTRVFGGKSQYGQFINNKQDYDKWIESIEGNEIWTDYYPNSLIPISDLVADKSLSDSLAQAIMNYCKNKEIILSAPPASAISTESKFLSTGEIREKATRISGGDNAIYSVNGQTISWTLSVALSLTDYNDSIKAYRTLKAEFIYTAKENKSDWTELQIKTSRTFPLNRNVTRITSITTETKNGTIGGIQYNFVPGGAWESGVMRNIYVKIDGEAKDDTNNIGFDVRQLFVEYEYLK
jgi:hypothetical protein